MKTSLIIDKIQQLPEQLKRIVTKPEINRVSFDNLNDSNIDQAVNYIKTKTILDLMDPPTIEQRQLKKGDLPIILIFCQPSQQLSIQKNQIFPYAPISYFSWMESAGAICIPFPYNINEGSMQFLLQRSHGMVVPGGASNLYKSYENKQGFGPMTVGFLKIWRQIQKMWSKGINYPIWGTCLGLQVMLISISNDIKILSNLNSRGHQLEIYADYQNSKIFNNMPLNQRLNLQNKKLINFYHMHGISVKKFISCPKLTEKLKITAISKDKDGKWFCSAIEGRERPIFLSQFHPEKQAFQWTKKGDILANKQSIELSHYFAQSFVKQCMRCKNQKAFINSAEMHFYSCRVFRQIYTPERHYKVYAIDFKFREYNRQQKKKIGEKPIATSKRLGF